MLGQDNNFEDNINKLVANLKFKRNLILAPSNEVLAIINFDVLTLPFEIGKSTYSKSFRKEVVIFIIHHL
jgi:hypothetical protein